MGTTWPGAPGGAGSASGRPPPAEEGPMARGAAQVEGCEARPARTEEASWFSDSIRPVNTQKTKNLVCNHGVKVVRNGFCPSAVDQREKCEQFPVVTNSFKTNKGHSHIFLRKWKYCKGTRKPANSSEARCSKSPKAMQPQKKPLAVAPQRKKSRRTCFVLV